MTMACQSYVSRSGAVSTAFDMGGEGSVEGLCCCSSGSFDNHHGRHAALKLSSRPALQLATHVKQS